MPEQDHLHSFLLSIHARAERESGEIRSEAEKLRSEELDAERRHLAAQRETELSAARAEAQKDAGRLVSEALRSASAAVSEKQQAIRESVFARVETRLSAFVSGEEYAGHLCASAERVVRALPGGVSQVFLREKDLSFVPLLKPYFPEGTAFSGDDSIRIGGLRARSADGRVTVDDTLDTLLAEQKRRFAETAGLDIS